MIRFAWLQFRTQALIAAGALAATAVALILTGTHLGHLYDTVIAPCSTDASCSQTTIGNFLQNYHSLWIWLSIMTVVIPGLIGIFWGAPLVARELETGTYRLAWTQSVSRTRWMATKLVLIVLVSMAVAGLFSLMVTWWAHPLDRVRANAYSTFDERNIVPIGYAAFAFVLGVLAGVVIRRTLPAIATVVVTFTAARLAETHLLRPRLLAPVHLSSPLDPVGTGFGTTGSGPMTLQPSSPRLADAWIYSTRIVDAAGHTLSPNVVAGTCPTVVAGIPSRVPVTGATHTEAPLDATNTLKDCVATLAKSYHTLTTYQPAGHYWTLQWLELAISLGAAAILGAGCVWWVRHRLA